MGADLEQWKKCLVKSIQLFCQNFCQYDQEAKIDGLLAITLDKKEVILVKLQEVDSDMTVRPTNKPSHDQSELLESILRYLAPSCRLLKKASVNSWQPVSDIPGMTDPPDRFTFLRSLGLAPATNSSSRSSETSAQRLQVVGHKSHGAPPVWQVQTSKSSESRANVNLVPLAASKKIIVKADNQFASANQISESEQKTCGRGTRDLLTQTHQSAGGIKNSRSVSGRSGGNRASGPRDLLKTNSTSPLSSSQSVTGTKDSQVIRDKKPVVCTTDRDSDLRNNNHKIASMKPCSLRPKKRTVGCETSSSISKSHTKSSPPLSQEGGVKRTKLETNVTTSSSELVNSPASVRPKAAVPANQKPPVKLKSKTSPKSKTSAVKHDKKNKALGSSKVTDAKRVHLKHSVSLAARRKMKSKIVSKQLLNKTKARLKGIYKKSANSRKQRALKTLNKVRMKGCGTCAACLVKEDCMTCTFCVDMKRYGGPNKLRKKCRMRQCRLMKQVHAKRRSGIVASENELSAAD